MKFQKWIASGILSVFLLNPLLALSASCVKPQIISAFSNGIQNTRDQAIASHEKLMMKSVNAGFSAKLLLYHAKGRDHNKPGALSFPLDIFEVFALLSKETIAGNAATEKVATKIAGGFRSPEARPSVLYEQLISFATKARDEIETLAFKQNTPDNVRLTVANDAVALATWLKLGNLVRVSAHSQGTLWANAAMSLVESEHPILAKQMRLVSAGMAASKVWQTPGSPLASSYVTNENDFVIGVLRNVATHIGLPSPAASNSVHPFSFGEPPGHAFDKIYLNQAERTGVEFLKLHDAGVWKLQDENRLTPLVSFEATVDVGPVGASHLTFNMELGKAYGNTRPNEAGGGLSYIRQNVRTGPSTQKTNVSWFCDASHVKVAGSSIQFSVDLPTFYGKPTLLGGTAQLDGKQYNLVRLGAGAFQATDITFWSVGAMTYTASPGGIVPTLVLE